ncbi:hypothetical protein NPIL_334881 [Nephila pilipes]|uniref:Uncharacterized protein n=1 Tax=Nephila pilipes TaxID=299642 RepID=A0A8X6TJM6_NEPPI|nr:hypothetical protein NPIL_334881 [Nephila pilipes]
MGYLCKGKSPGRPTVSREYAVRVSSGIQQSPGKSTRRSTISTHSVLSLGHDNKFNFHRSDDVFPQSISFVANVQLPDLTHFDAIPYLKRRQEAWNPTPSSHTRRVRHPMLFVSLERAVAGPQGPPSNSHYSGRILIGVSHQELDLLCIVASLKAVRNSSYKNW